MPQCKTSDPAVGFRFGTIQTKTVPIVFIQVTDPVSDGFVESLARPGGNVTGFTIFEHSFAGKWLEMLKEVVPAMTRVAVMQNPDHPAWNAYLNAIREVASRMGVEVTPAPARNADEVEAALAAFGQQPNGGVILLPSPLVTTNRALIAASTLRFHLPSIYVVRLYPASGGLMSYGIDTFDQVRQAANYVDRILKGAKPGELPVQAAGKFEMAFNLKTAKALGITIPQSVLLRANEVIQQAIASNGSNCDLPAIRRLAAISGRCRRHCRYALSFSIVVARERYHADDLREFRRDHDDADAARSQLPHQFIYLGFRAYVDPAGGLVEDQHATVGEHPLGKDDFLLVATAERAHRLAR